VRKRTMLNLVLVALFSLFSIGSTLKSTFAKEIYPVDSNAINPIPLIPIVLDGVRMAPEQITKFNDRNLYYLVDERAISEGVVYVFTSLQKIETHIENSEASHFSKRSFSKPSLSHCTGGGVSIFYSEINFSNFLEDLGPGEAGLNLYNGDDNDLESVSATHCNEYTKLYDGHNLTGSSLWLACCGDTQDLDIYGWDNRASSIKVTHYGS
jgi:hypothetical protein